MENIFSVSGGLSLCVSSRDFGSQDKGVSPKGAQDQLSFNIAHNLLGKPQNFQAIEMIYPSKVTARSDCLIVLCGASYQDTRSETKKIAYNKVVMFEKGETIAFGGEKKGFRTILLAIKKTPNNENLVNAQRSGKIINFISSNYKDTLIRVIKGPEYNILRDSKLFENEWSIALNSSQMGIPLEGDALGTDSMEMISQPVTDGTIQLSPGGPIVLMRHRQTVGGYPRILNILEADISKIAQFVPGTSVRFKLVEFEEMLKDTQRMNNLFEN